MSHSKNAQPKLNYDLINVIDQRLTGEEKWFGLAGTPVGETHRADRMVGGVAPFALLSGNNDFGNWVQIMGSADTPILANSTLFAINRYCVSGADSTLPFITQLVFGESADIAAKLIAEEFTEFPFSSQAVGFTIITNMFSVLTTRSVIGTKVWARTCCIGDVAKTLSFYVGMQEFVL